LDFGSSDGLVDRDDDGGVASRASSSFLVAAEPVVPDSCAPPDGTPDLGFGRVDDPSPGVDRGEPLAPLDCDDFVDPDSDPDPSEGTADATPWPVTTAAPIPKTTARPPTRPTCPPAPMAIYIQGIHRVRGQSRLIGAASAVDFPAQPSCLVELAIGLNVRARSAISQFDSAKVAIWYRFPRKVLAWGDTDWPPADVDRRWAWPQ
jgi:hypothetical protein